MLLDQPEVVAAAGAALESAGVSGRCRTVGGDFFTEVPAGGDAYLLSMVINDHTDAEATRILRTCREAMSTDAKLILLDMVVPRGGAPSFAHWVDLENLVMTGGRARTEAELAHLLAGAGFRLRRVVPSLSPVCAVEAVPC